METGSRYRAVWLCAMLVKISWNIFDLAAGLLFLLGLTVLTCGIKNLRMPSHDLLHKTNCPLL